MDTENGFIELDIHFENIEYLKRGTVQQQEAYAVLSTHRTMDRLKQFNPILVGSIPININIKHSDLDIICTYQDHYAFAAIITDMFKNEHDFTIRETKKQNILTIIANFKADKFPIEIFGQNISTKQQMAYQHMLVEHKILQSKGEVFRKKVIALKEQGYKTEPAFAALLGIEGDPYTGLLLWPNKNR